MNPLVQSQAGERASTPLEEGLKQLEANLAAEGATITQGLREPLVIRDELKVSKQKELSIPGEVRTWFGWHDGVEDMPQNRLPNGYQPLTWSQAVRLRETLRLSDLPLGGTCMPLLHCATSYLVVELAASGDNECPVRHWDTHDGGSWPKVLAPSINAMVDIWNDLFRQGVYRWSASEGDWWPNVIPPERRVYGLTDV